MALCPTAANPPAKVTESLISAPNLTGGQQAGAFETIGEDENFAGDFVAAGIGTRNFGTGKIMLTGIPDGTTIFKAWLIYNTYVSNNQPVAVPVTLKNGNGPATAVPATLWGICNSTCWLNPPAEPTTYLRNRIYVSNDISSLVTGNGNYTVAGLPVNLAMPFGPEGARRPGCTSSQGAVLVVIYEWNAFAGPLTKKQESQRAIRGINVYIGAKLLSNNPALWGGSTNYDLPFEPVKSTVDNQFFKGNANITGAAGDTQALTLGDTFAINQFRFSPPKNAWTKTSGNLLSVRKFSTSQIYDGINSAYATTNDDCIDWFLFIVSGDKTQPKAQMQIVDCAATVLKSRGTRFCTCGEPFVDSSTILITDTIICVLSNFVQQNQTVKDGHCRAVKYTGHQSPPKTNAPGMFPDPPFYISIDEEIMKVIKKCGQADDDVTPSSSPVPYTASPNKIIWTVLRAQNGTTAAAHKSGACIYMVKPPKAIKEMASGLAPTGQPQQRPNTGRPQGRQRKK